METKEAIYTRRSIRKFIKGKSISPEILHDICNAGIMAPSAHNRQPWKFKIISESEKVKEISKCSVNYLWSKNASAMIAVFLDKSKVVDYVKDVQSAGALMQNMLLYAHSNKVAACWIGDVLGKKKINDVLEVGQDVELMAIVALGYAQEESENVFERRDLSEFII